MSLQISYKTEDGTEFADIEKAREHEQMLFVVDSIRLDPNLSNITTLELFRILAHMRQIFNVTPKF